MVIISDSNEEKGRLVESELLEGGHLAWFTTCDVRKEEDVINLMKYAFTTTGAIHIVIINAGISRWKSPYDLTLEEWDDVLNTNARSCFLVSSEAENTLLFT